MPGGGGGLFVFLAPGGGGRVSLLLCRVAEPKPTFLPGAATRKGRLRYLTTKDYKPNFHKY